MNMTESYLGRSMWCSACHRWCEMFGWGVVHMQWVIGIGRAPKLSGTWCFVTWKDTTMSNPRLPADMLDHVVDHLHDEKCALRNCCLVSRSWIPRTRKYLFADIKLQTKENLESWKETFPDPSTSPAHYTKSLSISCTLPITAAETGDWIGGFPRVTHLVVGGRRFLPGTLGPKLALLYGFSPIKSLRVDLLVLDSPQIFDLVLSFPLLENLSVFSCAEAKELTHNAGSPDALLAVIQPSNSPAFSGTLELSMDEGMRPIAHRLLSLSGGIHFQKLVLRWAEDEDMLLTMALVERCSRTLVSLHITYNLRCMSIRHMHPRRLLTPVSSWPEINSNRPLEGDKAQGCGLSTQFMECRMGDHSTPNHSTRTSRSSPDLALSAFPPD